MSDDALKKYMEVLKEILNHPPYLILVFVTSVFMVVSIITQHYYEQSLALFLFSTFGIVWRHVVKDIRGRLKDIRWDDELKKFKDDVSREEHKKFNFRLTLFYQIVNTVVAVLFTIVMLKVFTSMI